MSKTCTIIKAGRSDTYGRPLLVGQIYTGPDDEVFSLWQAGFATVDGAPSALISSAAQKSLVVATQQAPYFIMPSTLTHSGSGGAFSLSGAIFSGFAAAVGQGFWGYFPADSGYAGLPAGWYFCAMTSDTVGVRYTNVASIYGSGIPANPIAFGFDLAGANAGTTAEIVFLEKTLPGMSMGPNGRMEATHQMIGLSASDTTSFRLKLGDASEQVAISQPTNTTTNILHRDLRVFNLGSNLRQWSPPATAATGVTAANYSSVDTSVNQKIEFTLQTSAATSAVGSLYLSLVCVYGE